MIMIKSVHFWFQELDGFVYYISNPPENSFLPVYCRRRILEGVCEKLSYNSWFVIQGFNDKLLKLIHKDTLLTLEKK